MKRTAEKVLSIISIVLNVIGIFVFTLVILFGSAANSDPDSFFEEIEAELYADPTLTEEDVKLGIEFIDAFLNFAVGFSWILIISFIASIVLIIIGIIKIDKNSKNAGIILLISSFLSGLILSLQGILLLIAGIMALVRKQANPVMETEQQNNHFNN